MSFMQIAQQIQQNGLTSNKDWLMNGNMGLCVFLHHFAHNTNSPEYEQLADGLLDQVFANLSTSASPDFENGLAGIGWGIEYLVQNGFAEGNTDEVLEEIDNKIFKILQKDNLILL